MPAIMLFWLDDTFAQIQRGLDDSFPNSSIQVLDLSSDEETLLIAVFSDREPGMIAIVDRERLSPSKRFSHKSTPH